MTNRFVIAVAISLIFSCTDERAAARTLQGAGYTNITFHGHSAWMCGDDDNTCTEFKATGPSGLPVRGAVGCGLVCKGCTIRMY